MPRKHWIINHRTRQYLETDAVLPEDWKERFPHTKDEPWDLVSALSVWDDQRTANGIYYNYDLCRDGGHFLLIVDREQHGPDEVKAAKAELRRTRDVVTLRVTRYTRVKPDAVSADAVSADAQLAAGYAYAKNLLAYGAKPNELRHALKSARLVGTYNTYHLGVAKAIREAENKAKSATVVVTQQATLHPDDEGVAGRYKVRFHEPLPKDLAANAALDVFHANVPIKFPDQFSIHVEGLEERKDMPSYLLGQSGVVEKSM